MDVIAPRSVVLQLGLGVAVLIAVVLGAFVSILGVTLGSQGCPAAPAGTPTDQARQGIPANYLALYRQAGARYGVPWAILAGIGSVETDHGRSSAPGVRSGQNAHGCCAGPMQFFNNRAMTEGRPTTWDRYAVDGNRDGRKDVYDPGDAIPSAASYLKALDIDRDVRQAIYGYNHSWAYVSDVLARAERYAGQPQAELVAPAVIGNGDACAPQHAVGPANLQRAVKLTHPRAFRAIPQWAMAGGRPAALVDARIYDNVVWIARRYNLRVTAGREGGHRTHGDGTAIDAIPANPASQHAWDESALRLAHDLGWTRQCGGSGSRPACDLIPAIRWVGYDGYAGHGSPATCTGGCAAHIHVSWESPCYGTATPSAPCDWVIAFSTPANHESHATTTRAKSRRATASHPRGRPSRGPR